MEEFTQDLFFHFFIMMMIPLVHNLLSKQKKESNYQGIFVAVILFSLFLTIRYPVQLQNGPEFDFKFIPIFIAFFYGGSFIGIISILSLVIYELLTNMSHLPILLINYFIIGILFHYFKRWYTSFSLQKKLFSSFLFYFVISITRFIHLINLNRSDLIIFLIIFSIVSYLSLAFIIYLIEINELQLYYMQKLQNAEKLNSISQLAASVAHEIRNPMTTIRGFLQILKEEKNLSSDQNMFVTVSLNELERTQMIIDDFLSLARPNNNDYQIINISPLLREIAEFMGPFAMISGTEIHMDVQSNITIKGSIHEFKQLIINLIKNGIEAMPKGGKLTVSASSDGNHNVVVIKDEGVGLSTSQLKKLGQPYYSTKTRGTGLGLLISFDIIKRMHGKVQIDSKEQIGTTFKLSFPKQVPEHL